MIQLVGGAFVFRAGLAVDADGSPHAYHQDSAKGLDRLDNARKNPKVRDGRWAALACNSMGVPFVQGPDDPAPGFYVPMTALVNHSYPYHDPRRYVDAEQFPYISIPGNHVGGSRGVRVGDLAWVCCGNRSSGAIVADVGPIGELGEGSIALAKALGVPSDPRHGGVDASIVSYVVFRDSARGWPRENYLEEAAQLFAAWGGVDRLARALG